METRVIKENLLYLGEEGISRYGRRALFVYLFLAASFGLMWAFQKVDAYLTPSYAREENAPQNDTLSTTAPFEIKEASLTIPKIGVAAPVYFVDSSNPDDFLEPLEKGVAHYPSAIPGQKGTAVLLGHSAPPGWLGSYFDGVFSDLTKLEQGDTLSVSVNGVVHQYRVAGKTILHRGEDIPSELMESEVSRVVLLSCWPPGIDNKRIMIQAEKI